MARAEAVDFYAESVKSQVIRDYLVFPSRDHLLETLAFARLSVRGNSRVAFEVRFPCRLAFEQHAGDEAVAVGHLPGGVEDLDHQPVDGHRLGVAAQRHIT